MKGQCEESKRQPTALKKVFSNHMSDKRLDKINNELIQINNNNETNPVKKWVYISP